jgi:MFS family permease
MTTATIGDAQKARLTLSDRVVLFSALTAITISQSFVFAYLPAVGRRLGMSDLQIGSIGTLSAVAFVVAAPLLGALSERFGRVPFIVWGLVVTVVSKVLIALAISAGLGHMLSGNAVYAVVVVNGVVLSFFWAGMFPAAQAFVADTTEREERTAGLALLGVAFGAGTIMGPAVVSALSPLGDVAPIYGIAAIAAVTLAATLLLLREPPRAAAETGQSGMSAAQLASLSRLLVIALATVAAMTMLQQVIGFRLQDLFALSQTQTIRLGGIALTVMALCTVAVQTIIMSMAPAGGWNAFALLRFGALLCVVGAAALALLPSPSFYAVLGALAAFGAGLGLVFPGSTAALSLMADPIGQGRAAGMYAAAQGFGMVVGPIVGAAAYGWRASLPFVLAALLSALVGSIMGRASVNAATVPAPTA